MENKNVLTYLEFSEYCSSAQQGIALKKFPVHTALHQALFEHFSGIFSEIVFLSEENTNTFQQFIHALSR